MSFPWSTAQVNAVARLLTYNSSAYDPTTNPTGFGLGGHVPNFVPSLQDLSAAAGAAADAANAAGNSATAAANSETNAALSAARLQGTSTSSQAIGTGSKSWTTQSGKLFAPGTYVTLVSAANPTINKMSGEVTAYSGVALTVNVDTTLGSGTYADWNIYVSARPGIQGITGLQGLTGPTPARQWNFATATADADPGNGSFRINNASYGSATTWYLDNLDKDGNDATSFLDTWDDSTNTIRGTIYAVQISDPTKRLQARVTGTVVDGTGYRKISVTPIAGASFSFDAGAAVAVEFVRAGDKGSDGAGAGTVIGDSGTTVIDDIVLYNTTDGVHIKTSGVGIGTSGSKVPKLNTANVWSATQTHAGQVDFQQDFLLSGDISPTQITADQNDYAPTGHGTTTTFRLTSDTARSITGLSGGADGRIVILGNDNASAVITLADANTGSSAANRFSFGFNVVLSPKQRAILQYDATDSRWKLIAYDRPPQAHGQGILAKSGSNLVLSPKNGNHIIIAGVQQDIPSAGVSLTPSGLSAGTTYYIYAYMSSGTMTLEASTTVHVTDSTYGVEIKSGDSTRTLVGVVRVITGPAFADTATQRFVRSWFNRLPLIGYGVFTAQRTTVATSTAEINTEIRVEFVCFADDRIAANGDAFVFNSGSNYSYLAISFDGVTPTRFTPSFGTNGSACGPRISTTLTDGYHYATLFGSVAAGTGTFGGTSVFGSLEVNIG